MLIGKNPCIANEPCTIAVYDPTAETDTLTAASNAIGSVVATARITFTPSPTPSKTWPRFLLTQANLPAMRAKATSDNILYRAIRAQAVRLYDEDKATWSWTCNAGNGQPSTDQLGKSREYDAWYFTYMALIDPLDRTYNWSCYAHDVSMYFMNRYMAVGPPYYFPQGANQWSDQSWIWSTIGDWLRGSGAVTTSADLATMRTFYSYLVHATFQQGNYVIPTNAYNSAAMFHGFGYDGSAFPAGPNDLNNIRGISGNNYNMSRMLILAAAGLTFNDDTTDAPNIPPGKYNTCGASRYQVCIDGTSGSLRAYWNYLDGAALYAYWAHIEDPTVSWKAYQSTYSNLPTEPQCEGQDLANHPCFGDSRDGGSSEGNWYDYSMYRMRWLFNLLHTSGMDDPLLYGPQMSASTSSWWDMKYVHDLEDLTGPTKERYGTTSANTSTNYPSFAYLDAGDLHMYNLLPSDAGPEAALLTFDSYTGRTDRANALKWYNFNLALGGPLGHSYGCTATCGYDENIQNLSRSGVTFLDMFIALPATDPVGGVLPSDPRPSLPTDFYDGSFNQNGILRTGWSTSNSTLLSWWFNNSQDNHEYNYDGRFDIFSCLANTCEYITKGRAVFTDYNYNMAAANIAQNELGIINSTGSSSNYQWYQMYLQGGQFPEGSAANPSITVSHSELPAYAAANSDTTGAYNGAADNSTFATFNDVKAASRAIVYIKGSNLLVFYDRATVRHTASTQTLNQITTGTPTISGNTVSWLTRSSTQKAYLTSLLPNAGTIANTGLPCPYCDPSEQLSDWEPAAVIHVTPPGRPTSSQFLSVLQWGPARFTPSSPSLVQSSAGSNFDGALVGSSLVMFMRNWPGNFATVTYPASGATKHYISDLMPNTAYTILGAGAPGSATTDNAGVLVFSATGTGDIVVRGTGKVVPTAKNVEGPRKISYCVSAGAIAVAALASYAVRSRYARTPSKSLPPSPQVPQDPSGESSTPKSSLLDTRAWLV
jgi:hypothetical protein